MVRAERLPTGGVLSGLAGTVLVHAAAVAVLLGLVTSRPRQMPPSYAVELVAAPAAAAPATTAPAPAVRRPVAPPAAPKPKAKPTPVRQAPARPTTTKPVSRPAAPVTPLPGETPGTGRDIANLKFDGKAFPFPEYLQNLVSEVYRRWNRPIGAAPLRAEVGFVILRDGSVRNIHVVESSRSYSFDLEAQGAIEAAGTAKAFGPLPAGYPADYLPISFVFAPRQGG